LQDFICMRYIVLAPVTLALEAAEINAQGEFRKLSPEAKQNTKSIIAEATVETLTFWPRFECCHPNGLFVTNMVFIYNIFSSIYIFMMERV
jgi:hypothetical protein